MKINNIIITLNEQIFLSFCKSLDIKNIKTNEDIIIGEIPRNIEGDDEETLIIIHGKDPQKTVEYISSHYIYIEKIILANTCTILSNGELQNGDVIIPNTFLGENEQALFIENTVGDDYNLTSFGLIINGICSSAVVDELRNEEEFIADIHGENVFTYLQLLQKEEKLDKTSVMLQVGDGKYENLIAVSDMSV